MITLIFAAAPARKNHIDHPTGWLMWFFGRIYTAAAVRWESIWATQQLTEKA